MSTAHMPFLPHPNGKLLSREVVPSVRLPRTGNISITEELAKNVNLYVQVPFLVHVVFKGL